MNTSVLTQIEDRIEQLSLPEQLWLIECLGHRVRENTLPKQNSLGRQLADMAADPEIQAELHRIDEEFTFVSEKEVLLCLSALR